MGLCVWGLCVWVCVFGGCVFGGCVFGGCVFGGCVKDQTKDPRPAIFYLLDLVPINDRLCVLFGEKSR